MAKFEFPVKLPRFTTEEFDKKKADYVAKYGYTIQIPGFSDILKLGIYPDPSAQEVKWYKDKNKLQLGDRRYEEIRNIMARKKRRFLAMMGSPQPRWMHNIGSALTFLDDTQDALGTLSMVTRLGAHALPSTLGKILMGPAGWALMAADVLNIGIAVSRLPYRPISMKSDFKKIVKDNPFTERGKVSRASKLRKLRPGKGEIIEALQTTNGIFGIGLCLGPIVGLAQDLIFGLARVAAGKRVGVRYDPPGMYKHELAAAFQFKASCQLWSGGQEMSDDDHLEVSLAMDMATQVLYPYLQTWNPLDEIEGIENLELEAPHPTSPSTLLLFEEEGIDWKTRIGWPTTSEVYSNPIKLWDTSEELITNSFDEYAKRQKHTQKGLCCGQTASMLTENMLALTEGEDMVEYDFTDQAKFNFRLLEHGKKIDPETTPEQVKCLSERLNIAFFINDTPSWSDLESFCLEYCGIKLIV